MRNTYIDNWETVKDRFEKWWKRESWERPLMHIVASGKTSKNITVVENDREPKDKYLNTLNIIRKYRNFCETHYFLADAFPAANINLGPGSLALYLGGEPEFAWDTVWYREMCSGPEEFRDLHYDEENHWWKFHQNMMKEAVKLSAGDFYVNIPDIIENLDILSALRGPQNLCFDILDNPQAVLEGSKKISALYFKYYDRCYDLLKDRDSSSSYTAFCVMGRGRAAKIQSDFCALISPQVFRELIQPSLAMQCRTLDYSVYHLDGSDAIKHIPALMEIRELNALQWTCGAGKPDGGSPDWYPIYDQVRTAGKGLHITINDGAPEDWEQSAKRLVKRYGATGLYLLFPDFPDLASAQRMASLFG